MFEITGHTQLICLLGSPVAHSISPMMHNEAFRLLNLPYAYLAFDVKPEELRTAVDGLKALGAKGFNLTMPHKNAMARMADQLSPAASLCGAVNTIVIKDGVLTGHTTDGTGYMRAASETGYPLPGKVMTLLGAGGAATSILVQAALDGVKEIRVFNRKDRNYEKAESLIEKLNQKTGCKVTIHDLKDEEALGESILTSQVLTNGTNVGMAPHEEECIIRDLSVFHKDLVVSDAIYNPRETKLMRLARDCGCPAFNGLYMLLYQGAESFRLWTGCEMPVDEIRKKYFA